MVVQTFYSLATFHKLSNIDRTIFDFSVNCSEMPAPVREDYAGHLISGWFRRESPILAKQRINNRKKTISYRVNDVSGRICQEVEIGSARRELDCRV